MVLVVNIFSSRNILQLSQVLPFTSHACMEIGTHSTTNVCFINGSATQGPAELGNVMEMAPGGYICVKKIDYWGKILVNIFDPCKRFDISQL